MIIRIYDGIIGFYSTAVEIKITIKFHFNALGINTSDSNENQKGGEEFHNASLQNSVKVDIRYNMASPPITTL
jgi:hypothetical protein